MRSSDDLVAGIVVERHESLDSTNLEARRLVSGAALLTSPRLIVARTQTAGRGRQGRSWASPHGGLWCTLLWPAAPRRAAPIEALGLRIGVACTMVVARAAARGGTGAEHDVRLKWPNDVLIRARKVAGILTEIVGPAQSPFILVGVGINANFHATDLPPELRERATTLLDLLGEPIDLDGLLADLCASLSEALRAPGLDKAKLDFARSRLHGLGEPMTLAGPGGAPERGELVGLDDSGLPLVRTSSGVIPATPADEGTTSARPPR
jgi:BirA family biotin operon repressor/biotin-[acetyl-CoA-carboxylase] ligase